ncbi:MAG: efflux RND transporter permease subunit [Candidatus Izemoplasma sp.]|nr:efflux RND transporter permease subunit [Candidatus Izemoplasma sp.]
MSIIIRLRWVFILLAIGLLAVGMYLTTDIPKQEMPTMKTPYLLVSTTVDPNHQSLDQTIQSIHDYLEDFEEVNYIKTRHIQNTVLFEIVLSYDTSNVNRLKETLTNGMKTYENGAITSVDKIHYVARNSMIFMITGELDTLNITANTLIDELSDYDDIIDISQHNMYSEQLEIVLHPELLSQYNISPLTVYNILDSQEAMTDHIIDDTTLTTIKQTPLQANPLVTLEDVASFNITPGTQTTYNDDVSVIVAANFKDGIDYTVYETEIQNLITEIENTSNHTITPIVFLPEDVNDQFNNLLMSVLYAIVIVFFVIMLGLGIRQSLIVVAIVPTIVFTTIIWLYVLGYELHKLSIIGLILSIGMMVDNAIVLTEGTKTFLEQGYSKERASMAAIKKNFWPIFTATLTTLIAFGSIIFIPGFVGELIRSLPVTVLITIALSLLISVILTPILAMFFVKTKTHKKRSYGWFDDAIKRSIHHPYLILSVILILGTVIGYFTVTTRDINLYPSEEKTDFYVNIISEDERSLSETVNQLEIIFDQNEYITGVSTAFNTDLPRFHFSQTALPMLTPSARLYVNTTYQKADMLAFIETFDLTPFDDSVTVEIKTLKLSPPDAPLEVILTGENATSDVNHIYTLLQDDARIDTIYKTTSMTKESLRLSPLQSMDEHTSQEQLQLMNRLLIQETILQTTTNNNTIQTKLMIDHSQNIGIIPLTSLSDGSSYPLTQLVTFNQEPTDIITYYYNNHPAGYLSITPHHNRDIVDIEATILEEISNNTEVEFTGENELFITLSNALLIAGGIAIVIMYLLLVLQFRHFIYPLVIFTTIPLAFIGSLSGLLIFDYDITVSALIGMVSLIGVTVNIGILLIEEIIKQTQLLPLEAACIIGTKHRIRPILLTSMTTILGLIPLYITGGDFFRPLAITFIFGMIFATLLSLFVIPMMVYLSRKAKM